MKHNKALKKFIQDNYTMICSLMTPEEERIFGKDDPCSIILDEINRQMRDKKSDTPIVFGEPMR